MIVRRSVGALRDRLLHGRVGRLEGQEQVGAGVAVGDRIDVEGVDLLAGLGERRHDVLGEAQQGVDVEGSAVSYFMAAPFVVPS